MGAEDGRGGWGRRMEGGKGDEKGGEKRERARACVRACACVCACVRACACVRECVCAHLLEDARLDCVRHLDAEPAYELQ
eukprot:35490-Pleurochrysis_carterae.AAC.1